MMRSVCFLLLLPVYFAVTGCNSKIFIPFNDKHIVYEGRVAFTREAAELMWSGTSVKFNFSGTSISGSFRDADTANYYNVIIDNKLVSKIQFDREQKMYVLAEGLEPGDHLLELFKRTEWDKGKTFFYGFECSGKTLSLAPPQKPARKIEFFGNSITCGYGIEDAVNDSPVGFFENSYNAYAAITARHFNAQAHYTAKSGIGITVSWFPMVMSEMYDRLDPTNPSSKWNFAAYTPDVVVINLLQNDYWLTNMPDHPEFIRSFGSTKPDSSVIIAAYKNFVQLVRQKYPQAQIICMLGNMDITSKGSQWPGYVQSAVQLLNDERIKTFFVPYKETVGHPKTGEQKVLADALIKFMEENTRW